MNYLESILLALGGYAIHLLKMWLESIKRKEAFDTKVFFIGIAMNIISMAILIFIGETLPPDLLTMSPLTCVLIGSFNSSMLAGIINLKKPKDINDIQ